MSISFSLLAPFDMGSSDKNAEVDFYNFHPIAHIK